MQSKYPPLRGELWYRREPSSSGAKTGKKFLDVYFLEETLPELLDLLLGEKGPGVGLSREQVRLWEEFRRAGVLARLCFFLGLPGRWSRHGRRRRRDTRVRRGGCPAFG